MQLNILSAKTFNIKLKCTIQLSGKLGFTEETSKQLGLTEQSYIKFANDDEDNFYLINCKEKDEDAFKVNKAGRYFYVNTKALFDALKYDYTKSTIMFDMIEMNELGDNIYKLKERKVPRKQKSKNDE